MWLIMLTGLMGCWLQGQEWPLGSLLGVCLGQLDQMICYPLSWGMQDGGRLGG